jgi:hypothetical protein
MQEEQVKGSSLDPSRDSGVSCIEEETPAKNKPIEIEVFAWNLPQQHFPWGDVEKDGK